LASHQTQISGSMMNEHLEIDCQVYNAKLSRKCCEHNLEMAMSCGELLRSSVSGSACVIYEVYLDRLAGCSQCGRCPDKTLQRVFVDSVSRDITILVDSVIEPHVTHDPQEQREKRLAKYKRYDRKRGRTKASRQ
jgi:hypothetical protein